MVLEIWGTSPKGRLSETSLDCVARDMGSFDLSCEDAWDKDQWILRIKWETANPGLPRKWPLKRCYVCAYVPVICHTSPTFYSITRPRSPRVHLPVTYYQFRGTTFHLVLMPFVSLHQRYRTPYLLTFCNLKLLVLLDVIYRPTTFSWSITPLAAIPNAP